jgi:hypothetical protein
MGCTPGIFISNHITERTHHFKLTFKFLAINLLILFNSNSHGLMMTQTSGTEELIQKLASNILPGVRYDAKSQSINK